MVNKEKIISVIKTCYDPEIPVDLWNLGLIYNIDITNIKNKSNINITMTLTTPGCGMVDIIANNLKNELKKISGINEVNIDITFDPPWQPKMMTKKAKKILGLGSENNSNNNWE
tara:strand:- start:5911 stop:6252 length:342 start_codon:yes stop_codon:yes gene_type:complete